MDQLDLISGEGSGSVSDGFCLAPGRDQWGLALDSDTSRWGTITQKGRVCHRHSTMLAALDIT